MIKNDQGALIDDPEEVANCFAKSLAVTFSDSNDPEFDHKFLSFVHNKSQSFFSNPEDTEITFTTPFEVKHIIKKGIKARSAPGPDNITNLMIKRLPPVYHIILSQIINACLQLSYMPQQWKSVIVIMILKPGKDLILVTSYRPISLLNTFSKLFERVILIRLSDWLDENHILSELQAGFRKNKQTKDHIFRIITDVQAAFNRGFKIGAIFIDIEKAFDKVWHEGLLFKLDQLKVPNYLDKWIANYLESRTFSVRNHGALSVSTPIHAGVPQGSVLGPILFNIYFNDITEVRAKTELALFADDVASWTRGYHLSHIQKKLQSQLQIIEKWMSKWRTKLSTNKTTYLIFNKSRKFDKHALHLSYKGSLIHAEKNPKFLGLTLDPGLRFNEHAKIIQARTQRRVNMLKKTQREKLGILQKAHSLHIKITH